MERADKLAGLIFSLVSWAHEMGDAKLLADKPILRDIADVSVGFSFAEDEQGPEIEITMRDGQKFNLWIGRSA